MTATVLPHRYAMVEVGQVTPHPANPNIGDIAGIGESIEGIGFFGVVLVHESTGHILAGEHRWRAAQDKGLTKLPAIVIDCDDRTAEKIMMGDNRYARLGQWDTAKLVELLESHGEDLTGSGFTADDRDLLTATLRAMADRGQSSRDYDPDTIGPAVTIHAPLALIEAFRSIPGDTDADRLRSLLTCPECGHEFVPVPA